MLRLKALADSDTRTCDECGSQWWELCDYNGCPDQPYTQVRGSLGAVALQMKLCPECVSEVVEVLYPAMGVSISVLRANQLAMIENSEWGITEEPGTLRLVRVAQEEAG